MCEVHEVERVHCVAARPHRGLGVAFEFALGVGDGVSPFSLTYLRLVSQWMTYVSRSALNDSKSVHLLPLKNSSFRWPKTCSVAPLSMQLPFRDILCTMPARSSLPVHAACRLPAHVAVEYRSGPLGHLRRHGHHRTQHARCFGMQGKPTMSYRDL